MNSKQLRTMIVSFAALLAVAASFKPAAAQNLPGRIGWSQKYGSGWIDFAPPINFSKGDRLRITVGGTANRIMVRLLPNSGDFDSTDGMIGGAISVPRSRVVEITLDNDRKDIKQLSVHGGVNPFGQYPLGGNNGPATITSAERTAASH